MAFERSNEDTLGWGAAPGAGPPQAVAGSGPATGKKLAEIPQHCAGMRRITTIN